MKIIYEILTPIGTGTVRHGEFMCNDGRENKYHCWWNGDGIGGETDTLKDAKEYLIEFTKEYLMNEINKFEEKIANLFIFLREFKSIHHG